MTADRQPRRVGIVGGGMLGLTLALRLAQRGDDVTVFEGAERLGGLASAWSLDVDGEDPVVWDRHYHVTLLSDLAVRGVLGDLGLERDMRWVQTKTGFSADGRLSSVSDSIDYLRLPSLSPVAKARLATTILYGSRVHDWEKLEQIPVSDWLTRWSGRATYERFWLPLLRAKLGESYRDASAAFIWATIQRLYAARRSGMKKELFGYVPGGYARILERFGVVLAELGVDVRLGASVASVTRGPDADAVTVTAGNGGTDEFDDVVLTTTTSTVSRLVPQLTAAEHDRLDAVRYQGIVCASVVLRRPLSPYYLTYLLDPAPFTAVVEMSAFVDPSQLGGHSLVYLPKYVAPNDARFDASDDEIRASFLPALMELHPQLTEDDVLAFRVSRVRQVFALPTIGFSRTVPPRETSLPGVHVVTSAQIVNGTLNVNDTVQLAEQAAVWLGGPAPTRRGPEPRLGAPATVATARPGSAVVATGKPTASLSLDLDNLWSYQKTHGDPGWESYPSYLDLVIPRVLEFLRRRDQRITFFVVGQDAELAKNKDALALIGEAGHEIGNHSFRHEPWLHRYTEAELDEELAKTEDALENISGQRTTAFRGPGYSLSESTLRVLSRRGYLVDASTLPTYIGPLARAFYFRQADLTEEQRTEREALFGTWRDGRRPVKPYRWAIDGTSLLELPVTTFPGLKVPMHVSYLLFLAGRSPAAARAYWRTALAACKLTGTEPSLLLHPLDFLGGDDLEELAFFPGMELSAEVKMGHVGTFLDAFEARFRVGTMGEHAAALNARTDLELVQPRFDR
ncbi:MAG: dependent oxidoreductase [Actinomycetia bacterium]|nr:dependent oxidoreductase [Actinomycetes bacterium]